MASRGLRACAFKGRSGKRRICTGLCTLVLFAFLFLLLFMDMLEAWLVSLGRSRGATVMGMEGLAGSHVSQPKEFLLMPSPLVCQRAKPHLLTMVTSAPANQKARKAIRETWGSESDVKGRRTMTLFMLGGTQEHVLNKQLVEEAREYGDLVQGHFLDSYANLTLKTLSMLEWVQRFCPQAHFLAKVDDDVLFNTVLLLRYLDKHIPLEGDLYLGRLHMRVAPNRDPAHKNFLPATVYPAAMFPDYCSGTAYVLSLPAARKMAQAVSAWSIPVPLPPEDAYMGMAAQAAGILPQHSSLFSGGPVLPYSRCCYQAMVSVHKVSPEQMVHFWAEVHSQPSCSWLTLRSSLSLCKIRALLGTKTE